MRMFIYLNAWSQLVDGKINMCDLAGEGAPLGVDSGHSAFQRPTAFPGSMLSPARPTYACGPDTNSNCFLRCFGHGVCQGNITTSH